MYNYVVNEIERRALLLNCCRRLAESCHQVELCTFRSSSPIFLLVANCDIYARVDLYDIARLLINVVEICELYTDDNMAAIRVVFYRSRYVDLLLLIYCFNC
jgi:hypothetical protein